jgi:hypothetical protein
MKDAVARLGRAEEIVEDYLELQRELYVTVDS